MFEISIGAILVLVCLFLFPSLLFHVAGFAALSLISGGFIYYLASWLGVLAQNAFWLATVIGFLTGAFATHYLSRRRGMRRGLDHVALR